jgi:hypothetical protein
MRVGTPNVAVRHCRCPPTFMWTVEKSGTSGAPRSVNSCNSPGNNASISAAPRESNR